MSGGDFYDLSHEGTRLILPRVTSILEVLDKSRPLMWWARKVEAQAWRVALETVLTEPGELSAQRILDAMDAHLKKSRAMVEEKDAAANIGSRAHAIIQWHTRKRLGLDVGPEPSGPDAAIQAVTAWFDWCHAVDFEPLSTERTLYCPSCAVAGTCDVVAKITLPSGRVVATIDYKTSKAVYAEAHLQVRAYRHMLKREGITTDCGLILRLPKLLGDPAFEAVVAKDVPYSYFAHVARAWRVWRYLDGKDTGHPMTACSVEDR